MKRKNFFALLFVAALAAMIGIVGCSDGSKTEKSSVVDEIADSVASSVTKTLERARLVKDTGVAESRSDFQLDSDFDFTDLVVVDTTVYAVSGEQLVIYSLSKRDYITVPVGGPANAVVSHAGKVYVGGESVFELVDSVLEPVEIEFPGVVTELYSHGYRLMIGTTAGLYAKSIFGNEALFDDIKVTAMAEDNNGLWVGTDGHGLYRWSGSEFKRRYLLRDTAVFDFVNALDFNHDHLYVGTDEALYIFDGGRWETVKTEDGLPSNAIRSIDASNWMVYIATDAGIISWFNYDLYPVEKIGDLKANVLRTLGRKILVGTSDSGLILKSGPVVTTLIEPATDEQSAPVAATMH